MRREAAIFMLGVLAMMAALVLASVLAGGYTVERRMRCIEYGGTAAECEERIP